MITSPYNFVPLSEKVVMPFWAKHVSHDIPFEDSQSGVLKLIIKAESPIYVRNGVPSSVDKESPEYKAFNKSGNNYFIPGSSIKGMIRSVMEIMSFGRMANKVNDHRYSVRDFQNDGIYPKSALAKEVFCGWLYKRDGEFLLDDCGKPGRISHKNLDVLCPAHNRISAFYQNAANITSATKSAEAKYIAFPFAKTGHKFVKDYDDMDRVVYKIDSSGKDGTIVMSGQPGVRREPDRARSTGKHLEFVFFNSDNTEVKVEDEAIKNFFFAYYDHDVNQQKPDWKWRKAELDRGGKIPVFFRVNGDGSIKDMGLSLLYKITFKNSITESINNIQGNQEGLDLAETIFGYAEKHEALKGRIHVGHAFATEQVVPLNEKLEVLAGPKASYYPNYIEQNNNKGKNEKISGDFKTYMNEKSGIRGWKRYPIHTGDVKRNPPPEIKGKVNDKIGTKFCPLPSGTTFEFDISYHNLRKEELGALISAITFHNTSGLFHSIGSGKPLGYGKISVEITNLDENTKLEMLKAFELYMDCALENSTPLWFQSIQIKELLAMAKAATDDSKLKYMELASFVNAKGRKQTDPKFALQKYSFISNNNVDVQSLIIPDELNTAKRKHEAEKLLFINQRDIESIKADFINKNHKKLTESIESLKAKLIGNLRLKRQQILEQEKQESQKQKFDEKIAVAQSGIPNELQLANTFKSVEQKISTWLNLLKIAAVPENFRDSLCEILSTVVGKDPNIKNKLTKLTPNQKSKIIEWVGEIRAANIFGKMN